MEGMAALPHDCTRLRQLVLSESMSRHTRRAVIAWELAVEARAIVRIGADAARVVVLARQVPFPECHRVVRRDVDLHAGGSLRAST